MECTPAYLGRDPELLKMLSDSTGMNLLTNTGYYGARNNQHLPDHAFRESARELADRWIAEWTDGIEDTGIRPGFIKIGVASDTLSGTHEKLVRAAALTHLATGLVIASHTGPSRIAFREIEILKEEGVSPEAFIWVHAQSERDYEKYREAALQGAWVSLDGVSENNIGDYIDRLDYMRSRHLLDRVLLSHDAGWYRPGEPGGGSFRPYSAIHEYLMPALLKAGFTGEEVNRLLIDNPASAFRNSVKMNP
jgi:phosphotriesterase-related protein